MDGMNECEGAYQKCKASLRALRAKKNEQIALLKDRNKELHQIIHRLALRRKRALGWVRAQELGFFLTRLDKIGKQNEKLRNDKLIVDSMRQESAAAVARLRAALTRVLSNDITDQEIALLLADYMPGQVLLAEMDLLEATVGEQGKEIEKLRREAVPEAEMRGRAWGIEQGRAIEKEARGEGD